VRPNTNADKHLSMQRVSVGHIIAGTNCGMVPLSRDVARGKLHALANGAALVRAELGEAR
jgi:5-methyltetrahydropteroyltriglutamate--homocysteine methyltransferase